MKISELKNAPQWLLDADTHNADVDFDSWGRVVWHSGDWHGGVWHSGVWRGGDWHSGDWWGGVWWGENIKNAPMSIYSFKWPVVISQGRMQIGCERHTHEEWRTFDDKRIVKMDRGALKFWRGHKDALLAMCAVKAAEANASKESAE